MHESSHQNIQHQLFRIKHTELNELFFVMSLRSFVAAMLVIFIPIYLFNLGFSIRDISWMYIVLFASEFCFEYFAARLINEIGPKHTIAFSLPLLILHFWMLGTIPIYHWPLWFPAVVGGINMALYWQAYHFDFSKAKHRGSETKEVSKLYIILAILGAVAPFIGGLIATNFGIGVLYGLVIGLLLFAFLPLLGKKEEFKKRKIDFKRLKICDIKFDIISYMGAGVESTVATIIWPLFIFIIVKSYQSVGFIASISLVMTIFVTYLIGKKVSNKNRHKIIKTSSYLDALIYILFTFVDSVFKLVTLNLARSLVSSLRSAPYTSEYYLHADERSRNEYLLYMESAIDLSRILVFLIIIVLSYFFSLQVVLTCGILLGAVGALMTSLMPRAKCELPYKEEPRKIKLLPKLRPKYETN